MKSRILLFALALGSIPMLGAGTPSATPPAPGRILLDGQFGTEKIKVWGWWNSDATGKRTVGYYPSENPHLNAPSPPAADTAPNYGLNLQEIRVGSKGTVVTNDNAFARKLQERGSGVPIMTKPRDFDLVHPENVELSPLDRRMPLPDDHGLDGFSADLSWGWVVAAIWIVAIGLAMVGFATRNRVQHA